MAEIASFDIADPPELWADLGFDVSHGAAWVSGTRLMLGSPGEGVIAWLLRDAEGLRELPIGAGPAPEPEPTPRHPNGVLGLDHVVIATPDLARTIAAFEAAGIGLRRIRDTGTEERPSRQAFFRLGQTIAEVVGHPERARPGPARFYGLAFTVGDLAETARHLGDRLRPSKRAVQVGRQIATLDWAAGSSIPIAFMSPAP